MTAGWRRDRTARSAAAEARGAVAASFAGPAARLTSWFRVSVVVLLSLIGPVVTEPRLNVTAYRTILAVYALWSVGVIWWAYRRRVPPLFGVLATVLDLSALVLLTTVGNGPTSYLQPFFIIQPIIVVLQLRPRLTAGVGLFIAGGYAAIWVHNLGIDGGPGDIGVVILHFGLLVWVAVATTASTAFLVNRSAAVLELLQGRQRLIADAITMEGRQRGRIAEDLHDGPLQNVIAARRNLEDVAELLPGNGLLDQTDRLLRDTAAALRGTVTVLHPQVLAQIGLAAALQELADQHTAAGRLRVHTDLPDGGHLPEEQLVYSTARELLNNVERHAQAGHAWLILRREGDVLRLTVRDDGVGLAKSAPPATSLGLATHQARAANVGGRLCIEDADDADGAGSGVRAVLEIPVGCPAPPAASIRAAPTG
ncbi:sensor histidine kinase [Nakamurella flava]|nr:ATP-binding protein [Nakamurella flava]